MHQRLLLLVLAIGCGAPMRPAMADECPAGIRGGWETRIPADALFGMRLAIEQSPDGGYAGRLAASGGAEEVAVREDGPNLRLQSATSPLAFEGRISADGGRIDGFVMFASNLYRVTLGAGRDGAWSTAWSPLAVATDSAGLDLYFDDDGSGGTGGYFFFRDDRLPGLFGLGAKCDGHEVRVREQNLGLSLVGTFSDDYSSLRATVAGSAGTAEVVWTRMSPDREAAPAGASELPARAPGLPAYRGDAPDADGDGWRTAGPSDRGIRVRPLADLVDAVAAGELPRTHSVLLAKAGELVFEQYFYGFDRAVLHDMRSASKSLTSTLVGLAIDRGLLPGPDARVLRYFPEYRWFAGWTQAKDDIRIRDLLTMSSGLDANDADPDSPAAEGNYQSQQAQPDWIRLALDAPMIAAPGTYHVYGSANPMILGGILDHVAGARSEWFADEALFRPLGIDSYRLFMDPLGRPYMGGGMYLRPRDMLKVGQVYLDQGRWEGRQIVPGAWVEATFGDYGRLEPVERNGNAYGYLWWHETYEVDGRSVRSFEARGNGGQYIFVVPELGAVAVVTSGNYRGGLAMTRQPQAVFRNYLLPALLD